MKLRHIRDTTGFTLAETLVAVAIASLMLAAMVIASVSLQKSFNAVDNYFATHMQQIRIIDFLSRDVKRSYIVSTTPDLQKVTCTIPHYLFEASDSDTNSSNIGTRRTPTISKNTGMGVIASYGARTVLDGNITNGSATLASFTAGFTSPGDVGKSIAGTGIPPGTIITSVSSPLTVTMSYNATATKTRDAVTIGSLTAVVYSIDTSTQPQSITRAETGASTAKIAASADNLVPLNTDVELSNTEYAQSTVTFLPIFTSGNQTDERNGTKIFSLSYLRNKRRNN